jgi:hypothetical protein
VVEESRLPEAGGALDDHEPTASGDSCFERRLEYIELTLALEEHTAPPVAGSGRSRQPVQRGFSREKRAATATRAAFPETPAFA